MAAIITAGFCACALACDCGAFISVERNSWSRNCLRPSSVLELIHASPPGQPFTLGGANRFCPNCADLIANGAGSEYCTLNCLSVPTIISTGDFTSVARVCGAQNVGVMKSSRSATLMS